MEISLPRGDCYTVKEPVVYHVAPNKTLDRWAVLKEGKKSPRAKNLSKSGAMDMARQIASKKARPTLVLVHKTRYIIERALQFS